jgi:hypothetical protein
MEAPVPTRLTVSIDIARLFLGLGLLLRGHDQIGGQGYDGATNMQGHLNGFNTLVMQHSKAAHSIHNFAHQLQLTVVAVLKIHEDIL